MKPLSHDSFFWGLWAVFFGMVAFPLIAVSVHQPMGYTTEAGIGPGTWPRVVSVCMMGLCLGMAVYAALTAKPGTTPLIPDRPGRVALCLLGFALYYLSVEWIGIAPASAIFFLLFTRASGARNLRIVIPIALILPTVLYLFFYHAAQIPLPPGPLGGLV